MNILANQTFKDARSKRPEAAAPAEPLMQFKRPQPELFAAGG